MKDAVQLENKLDQEYVQKEYDYMQGYEEASFSVIDDEVSENEFDERIPSLKRDTNMTPLLKQKFEDNKIDNNSNETKKSKGSFLLGKV